MVSDGNLLLPNFLHTKLLQILPGQSQSKQAVELTQLKVCKPIGNSLLEGKVHGFREGPDEVRILRQDQGKPGVKRKVLVRRHVGLPAREGESILLTVADPICTAAYRGCRGLVSARQREKEDFVSRDS